jgi:hypothetical protein
LDKSSTSKEDPSFEGIEPFKQLPERRRYFRDSHLLISRGILPVKELFSILKKTSSVQFENHSSGMFPLRRWLFPRSKVTNCRILEKDDGKPPDNMFPDMSTVTRLVRLPNSLGMSPENMLKDISRKSKFGTMSGRVSGIEPENKLPDRSRSSILMFVRFRMNCGKVPLRLLSPRCKVCRLDI